MFDPESVVLHSKTSRAEVKKLKTKNYLSSVGASLTVGTQNRKNVLLKTLKTTSVMASCAKACTLELLIKRHQSQQPNLMNTVLATINDMIISIAARAC